MQWGTTSPPLERARNSLVSRYQLLSLLYFVVESQQRALKVAELPVSDVVVNKTVSEFAMQGTSLQRSGDRRDLVTTATPRQYKVRYLNFFAAPNNHGSFRLTM